MNLFLVNVIPQIKVKMVCQRLLLTARDTILVEEC